jgi:hypothetical protein
MSLSMSLSPSVSRRVEQHVCGYAFVRLRTGRLAYKADVRLRDLSACHLSTLAIVQLIFRTINRIFKSVSEGKPA